jgi:hypothetical protein
MQKAAGLTAANIKDFCRKRNMDAAKFVEQVKRGTVIYDATRGTTLHST